jgi:hypothetical protein
VPPAGTGSTACHVVECRPDEIVHCRIDNDEITVGTALRYDLVSITPRRRRVAGRVRTAAFPGGAESSSIAA